MKNNEKVYADLMISNGKIATLDERGTILCIPKEDTP